MTLRASIKSLDQALQTLLNAVKKKKAGGPTKGKCYDVSCCQIVYFLSAGTLDNARTAFESARASLVIAHSDVRALEKQLLELSESQARDKAQKEVRLSHSPNGFDSD
jgi:hypothetical protein